MERLCLNCWFGGEEQCVFRTQAQAIADAQDLTPEEKHQAIAMMRKDARERACPNLNNVDPDYPGKKIFNPYKVKSLSLFLIPNS